MGSLSAAARGCLTAVLIAALAGCTTLMDGKALKAPHDVNADGADLALLDVGNYPTVPRAALGEAPTENMGTILEGHRLANNTVVPTDVDPTLTKVSAMNILTMQLSRGISVDLPDPAQSIVSAHHLLAGFSTARHSPDKKRSMINLVLRFPDPAAAADTAKQLSPLGFDGLPPTRPFGIPRHPDALARAYTSPDGAGMNGGEVVEAYLPHGPYLLYGWMRVPGPTEESANLVAALFDKQVALIDTFVATDPAQIAHLPMDPFGFLNRVIPADGDAAKSVNIGGLGPQAALHFQDDVIQATKDFDTAGVDAVGDLKTTVYRARDAAGAATMVESAQRWAAARPGAQAIDPPPGLPFAKCFEFTQDEQTSGARFTCVATADRYQIEVWSQQRRDAYQQTSAQYLLLIAP